MIVVWCLCVYICWCIENRLYLFTLLGSSLNRFKVDGSGLGNEI